MNEIITQENTGAVEQTQVQKPAETNVSDPTGLRDELKKNFAAAASKAAQERNDEKVSKVPSGATSSSVVRGEDGKFVKTGTPSHGTSDPTAPPQQTNVTAPSSTTLEAPSTWKGEAKALWPKLLAGQPLTADEAKLVTSELARREEDFKRGIFDKDGELKNAKSTVDWFTQVTQPYAARWQANGATPMQAVQHYIQLGEQFSRDPAGTIKWLASTARLDLSQLAQGVQQGGNTDPQTNALMQELNGLRNELGQLKGGWQQQNVAHATREIDQVITETDAQGNKLRPHFDNPEVFKEIQTETQILMQRHPDWTPRQIAIAAYDTAVWKYPETREKMIEAKQQVSRSSEDATRRAQIAALAAKEPKGGPPIQVNGVPNTDLRGLLTQGVMQLYSGQNRL
jgi:hypothetical protein